MKIPLKSPKFCIRSTAARIVLISLIFLGVFFEFPPFSEAQKIEIISSSEEISQFIILQENSLISLSNPADPEPKVIRRLPVIITAYSSTHWQTDDNPYLTAAGTWVRDGIVANNILAFGTKIRIPELFGDKIFVVEDRMSWEKGNYQIDIWFPNYWQALSFGAKRTYIEILEI